MIIGAVLGLLGSIIPEGLKFWKDWQDKKHEIEMFKLQMEYQQRLAEIRIAEARELANIEVDKKVYDFANPEIKPTGTKWVDVLQAIGVFYNQTVRPTITYIVIAGWLALKYAQFTLAGSNLSALTSIWTEMDNEFVGAVVMFWFGSRAFSRTFGRDK